MDGSAWPWRQRSEGSWTPGDIARMPDDTPRTARRDPARLLLVVADGVRPDVLTEEIDGGRAPALARLRAAGGLHTVTSVFPSVTGPGYVPFLMGRHPAHAGLPGLRWFDRSRRLRFAMGQSRSYAGIDIWHVDQDVHPEPLTLLELATPSLAAMSMLARGATHGRIGRSLLWMLRAFPSHFRGDLDGWRRVERAATAAFFRRFARVKPRSAVLAIGSPDKFAHREGAHSPSVRAAIGDIDAAIATAWSIAERGGWRETLHVWVVGDHGHAPVTRHDDLHGALEAEGLAVHAHPQVSGLPFRSRRRDVALMVGGNAMAHLYLHPEERSRRWWPSHAPRWEDLAKRLLAREAVDLLAVADDASTVEVRHAARGTARIHSIHAGAASRWSYHPVDGDPLLLGGAHEGLDTDAAWSLTATSPYPDALVQLGALVPDGRAGDLVLSASEGWDLRSRFEPVNHVSTHGALLREQMEVPLLVDVPTRRPPQRTTDVVPSALDLLGIDTSAPFDGRSFLR